MAIYKIDGASYKFPDDMPEDEVQATLSGILGGTDMQATKPKQDGDFLESFVNAAKLEGLGKNAVVDYMSLAGNYREAKALAEQHAREYPSSGAGQFLGSIVGGVPQSAAALIPIVNIAALSNFALRAGGQARFTVGQQREAGADISPLKETAAVIGYGGLTYVAERLGFKKLRGVIDTMSQDAMAEIGKAALNGSKKEFVKAIGKRLVPAATAMGLWEGTEEAFEQAGTNAIDKMYMDRDLFEGVPQAFGAGTLGGMMLSPAFAVKASLDMRKAMKEKDAAGDGLASPFDGSTFEESKAAGAIRPSKTIFLEDLSKEERNELRRYYNSTLKARYDGRSFDEFKEDGTKRKNIGPDSLLTKEEQDSVIAAWENRKAQKPNTGMILPPGMKFVTEAQLPSGTEGASTSAPERLAYEQSVEQQKSGEGMPIEGELYFHSKVDGSPITVPVNSETLQRQKDRLMYSGLVSAIIEDDVDFFDRPDGGKAYAYFNPQDRSVHLAKNILTNTVGHEMFEAAWTHLEALNDPVIQRGLDQFGGKERLADAFGTYMAGDNQNPGLMQSFGRWLRQFWTALKARLGKDISVEEFGQYVDQRLSRIGKQVESEKQYSPDEVAKVEEKFAIGPRRDYTDISKLPITTTLDNITKASSAENGMYTDKEGRIFVGDNLPNNHNFEVPSSVAENGKRTIGINMRLINLALKSLKDVGALISNNLQFSYGHIIPGATDTSYTKEGRGYLINKRLLDFTVSAGLMLPSKIQSKIHYGQVLSPDEFIELSKELVRSTKEQLLIDTSRFVTAIHEYGKTMVEDMENSPSHFTIAPFYESSAMGEYGLNGVKLFKARNTTQAFHTVSHEAMHGLSAGEGYERELPWARRPAEQASEWFANAAVNMYISSGQAAKLNFQSAGASRTQARFEQQDAALQKETSFWKDINKNLKRAWIDTSSNVKRTLNKLGPIGAEAIKWHTLTRGATAKAGEMMREYEQSIFKGLTPSEDKLLARIAQARREIALFEKFPEKYADAAKMVQDNREWLAELDQGMKDKLLPRVDALFAAYREVLDFALAEQLITQEAHQKMADVGPYLPREHLDFIDPVTYTIRGEKMSVRDSGFYRMKDLDESVVNNNMRLLLFEAITRLSSRAYKNRANRELLKLAQEKPDNPIVRLPQQGVDPKSLKGFAPVSMFVDGKEQLVYMPEDMAKEWIVNDPQINAQFAKWAGWMTGTTPLKMMATGMNPAFAMANFFRDVAHIYLTTNEYSSNLFGALPQLVQDLSATASDAWGKKGAYTDFMLQGGGMSFLTHQGKFLTDRTSKSGYMLRQLQELQDFFGYLGEFTEIWTRLAIRNRAMKNGKNADTATFIARNYLDFSQGGSYAKAADAVIPYLNASIQGTRGLARAFRDRPGEFAWKASQLGAVAGSLALANALVNPEIWDEISEDEKNNYFIITRPELGFKDKEGNQRYSYIRIPKDQGQKLIATIFEAISLAQIGKPIDSERFVKAATELLPIVPDGTLLPPLLDAIIGYVYNKDFYKNEDIWKGEDLSQRGLEYTSATNPAYIKLAELAPVLAPGSSNMPILGQELSPERTRYAVEQVFVRGNPFSWLVGSGFREMIKDMPGKDLERTKQEIWANVPGINRLVKTTYPGLRYKKEVEAMRREENTRLLKMRRTLDELVENDMQLDTAETKRALRQFISQADRNDRARLKERVEWTRKLEGQPNRQWWLEVASLSPEMRATAFYARWAQENPETQADLLRQSRSIPGVSTVRFRRQLRLLQRGGQRTTEP